MNEYTIKDIEELFHQDISDVKMEGKWVVITLQNGVRVKIRDWKSEA